MYLLSHSSIMSDRSSRAELRQNCQQYYYLGKHDNMLPRIKNVMFSRESDQLTINMMKAKESDIMIINKEQ